MKEDLLIRYILDEADEQERQQVDAWLLDNADHVKRMEQTRFLLDNSKRLARESPLTEAEAWERFKQKRIAEEPAKVKSFTTYKRWLQAAAAILILGVGAWAIGHFANPKTNRWTTINAYEKMVTDTLPDGSVIQLNKHSVISYSGRTVKLKGEAFFKVVHNDARPFTVQTNGVSITDIGTAFNIRSDAEGVEVIVESGIVKVSKQQRSVVLKQKQTVLVQSGNSALQAENNPDQLYQYYRTDEFVTDHTPLSRFVNVLNKAYGVNIQVKGSLAGIPISGTYKREALDTILKVLMLTTPEIHRVDEGNRIILTR